MHDVLGVGGGQGVRNLQADAQDIADGHRAAEVVQPLWRGAFSAARKPIVVAALRKNRSEHELRARIEATVGAVQIAYWDLVRARSERAARASAVQIATEQVSETRGLRRLGTGSDLDILEAEAAVSRRQQELLRSEQDVVAADGRLFATLGVRAGEGTWVAGRPILPTDSAELAVVPIDVEAQLALARDRRADVRAARERVAAELAALEVTEDRRRAALDLVAGGGTAGFAGTLATTVATAGVNGGGLTPPYQTDPAYDGGLGTSVKNALGHDLNVFVGVRTGDKGALDAEGNLKITGRVKDLFKTSKGKYVAPAPIEDRLVMHAAVEACCVTGANLGQPLALVMLNIDAARKAGDAGGRSELETSLAGHLQTINETLDPHEQLDCIVVTTEAWTVENDLITPTFKVKRNKIEDRFATNYEKWVGARKKVLWT